MTPAERNAVLEEAARLCDHELAACEIRKEEARSNCEAYEWEAACDTAEELAHRIRALKEQEPTT